MKNIRQTIKHVHTYKCSFVKDPRNKRQSRFLSPLEHRGRRMKFGRVFSRSQGEGETAEIVSRRFARKSRAAVAWMLVRRKRERERERESVTQIRSYPSTFRDLVAPVPRETRSASRINTRESRGHNLVSFLAKEPRSTCTLFTVVASSTGDR